MTPQEFELILNGMDEWEFAAFATLLPQDIANTLTDHRAMVKLFCDRNYYEAARRAVGAKITAEICG